MATQTHGSNNTQSFSGKGKMVDRGFRYPKIFVYIPKDVATDTNFPFQIGEDVTVTIEGDKLIIEKRVEKC